jgi:tetratricopeptide (TPR) repeat protein
MTARMRILVWLFRAFLFFTLFAFALNNQHTATVNWFFGVRWNAPLVIVVLVAFGAGCALGVLAMVPAGGAPPPGAPGARGRGPRASPGCAAAAADFVTRAPAARRPLDPPMDFDLQWLLIGLPVAFALGWLASRFDLRQVRRDSRDAPRAYFKGLNLLLNEQQDKAIDAFIEAVQNDPDTTDLHFALGNLFRRRGEFERAVRVHQHLLQRADLPAAERHRAQHALAQDFLKAGLFDRAEQAFRALDGSPTRPRRSWRC